MPKEIVNISFEEQPGDKENKEITCHIDYIETEDLDNLCKQFNYPNQLIVGTQTHPKENDTTP
jgi:hypothetical protein